MPPPFIRTSDGGSTPGQGPGAWARAAVFVGAIYVVVGVVFAWPTHHLRAWRLAAWVVSGAAFAAQLGYERFALRNAPRGAAFHAALAAALGAFGLALAANIHSLSIASTNRHRLLVLVALVVWPVMTALPAFLVGLAASEALSRLQRSTRSRS